MELSEFEDSDLMLDLDGNRANANGKSVFLVGY